MALIVNSPERKWPGGVIPYDFDKDFPRELKAGIKKAMGVWERKSALRFVERTNELDYVTIRETYGDACSSAIGRRGGEQFVNIVPDCSHDSMIHELGHAAGLAHEHKRYDRDEHVRIFPKNFEPGYGAGNWEIPKKGEFADHGNYDLYSIMHYGRHTGARRHGQYQWSTGWTTVEFYEIWAKIYMLAIKSGSGLAHLHEVNDDGTIKKKIKKTYHWGTGWTHARQYTCGSQRYLALYKQNEGTAKFYRLNNDGTLGKRVDSRSWTKGWTTFEFYVVGGTCFLFLLKASTGRGEIIEMTSEGEVGEVKFTKDWSKGWTQCLPYGAGADRFFSILKTSNGLARFYAVKSNGDLGDRIQDGQWKNGWTDVQFFQSSIGLLYMVTYMRSTGRVDVHAVLAGKYQPKHQTLYVESDWTTVRTFHSGVAPRLFLLSAETGVAKTRTGDGLGKIQDMDYAGDAITVRYPLEAFTYLIGTFTSPSKGDIAAVNYLVSSAPARGRGSSRRRP